MDPWIGHMITAAGMLAGLGGVYARISSRLTAIEVALGLRDNEDAREARKLRIREEIRSYCRNECPNKEITGVRRLDQTNPGI